jgi:hypothetical protein
MLIDADGALQITEVSSFTGVWGPDQLRHDDVPGAYVFNGPGDECRFVPMRIWAQELALKRILETGWLPRATPDAGAAQ